MFLNVEDVIGGSDHMIVQLSRKVKFISQDGEATGVGAVLEGVGESSEET